LNYYKRHLGDYAKDTKTLSVYEHGAYTVVLDYYYSEEGPVSVEDVEALCRPTSAKERASVEKVMLRYFKRDGNHWRHSYADRVIAEWQEKSAKAAESADKRWHSERIAPACPPVCEGNASHKPLAISQGKETTAASRPRAEFPADFEKAWAEYPKRNGNNPKGRALKAWRARIADDTHPDQILAGVRRYAAWCRATGKVGLETVMQAATFFGPERSFLEPWGIAEPPPKVTAPDCRIPGCKREGMPSLGGKCEVHYIQSKPLTPAQIAARAA
jgi:uncharacterized protein YdaU (DUF1376 family)